MNNVRKILVPIDFSEESANGLKYAVSLAEQTQAEVIALYVAEKKECDSLVYFLAAMEAWPMPYAPTRIPVDRLIAEKALDLHYFIERTVRNSSSVKIRKKVTLGKKSKTILEVAKEETADLVVFAIRQSSFFSYLMAPGKMLRQMWRFPCPVLVKPPVPGLA
jgi:nucleotide-binding universal stress UspA family protein